MLHFRDTKHFAGASRVRPTPKRNKTHTALTLSHADGNIESNFGYAILLKDTLTRGMNGAKNQTTSLRSAGRVTLPPESPQSLQNHRSFSSENTMMIFV